MLKDFEPPRPLNKAARAVWDRCAKSIWDAGHWHSANKELLCVFAEQMTLYVAFWEDIEEHGTLIPGSRDRGMIKNPSLSGLHATAERLIRLSRSIPLTGKHDQASAELDSFIHEARNWV